MEGPRLEHLELSSGWVMTSRLVFVTPSRWTVQTDLYRLPLQDAQDAQE
jgi:hypothetical protein